MSNYLTRELMEVTAKRENQIRRVQKDVRDTDKRMRAHLPIVFSGEDQDT